MDSHDDRWMPDDLKQYLGLEEMPICLFDASSGAKDSERECLLSEQIGLTCIQYNSNNDLFICLTTKSGIIVTELKREDHRLFLKRLFGNRFLKFYIYRGPFANLKLDMHRIKFVNDPVDLSTFDIHLSMRKHSFGGTAPNGHYTTEYFCKNSDKFKLRNLISLSRKWTGVQLIKLTKEEREALSSQPFNHLARNAIKKMASLTRAIGLEMEKEFDRMIFQESDNIYGRATGKNDDDPIVCSNN